VARVALAVGSRWDGDGRRWQMPSIGAVACGYGGIIGLRCWMGHPQRWGRGQGDGWFNGSGNRQGWHAVGHQQRVSKGRGSRD